MDPSPPFFFPSSENPLNLSDTQLCLLRSFLRRGKPVPFAASLLTHFLGRCGAADTDWQALLTAGFVAVKGSDVALTPAGLKAYRTQSKGRWF